MKRKVWMKEKTTEIVKRATIRYIIEQDKWKPCSDDSPHHTPELNLVLDYGGEMILLNLLVLWFLRNCVGQPKEIFADVKLVLMGLLSSTKWSNTGVANQLSFSSSN